MIAMPLHGNVRGDHKSQPDNAKLLRFANIPYNSIYLLGFEINSLLALD